MGLVSQRLPFPISVCAMSLQATGRHVRVRRRVVRFGYFIACIATFYCGSLETFHARASTFRSFAAPESPALTALETGKKFAAAEALFVKRDAGLATVREARAAYQELLGNCTASLCTAAAERLARLDYYTEFLVSDASERARIFEETLGFIEKAAPNLEAGIAPSPAYYFWKAASLGNWARAKGIVASLRRSGDIMSAIETGRALDPHYEGGGFDRIAGAVYFMAPIVNPFGPTFDRELALQLAQRSRAAGAYAGEAHPESATGAYFYETYQGQGEILLGFGRREDAKRVWLDALERIHAGAVSRGREPETKQWQRRIEELLKKHFPGTTVPQ